MTITLTVNGASHVLELDPDTPLLWVLRDHLGLTGTKFGCGAAYVRRLHGACRRRGGALLRRCRVLGRRGRVTTIEALGSEGCMSAAGLDRPRRCRNAAIASPA